MASDMYQVFYEGLRCFNFGRALYHLVYDNEIKLGSCRFFDQNGYWNPVAQITEIDKSNRTLKPMKQELKSPSPHFLEWHALCSKSVTGHYESVSVDTS